MRFLVQLYKKIWTLGFLAASSLVWSANPVQGIYVGFFAGASHIPSQTVFFPNPFASPLFVPPTGFEFLDVPPVLPADLTYRLIGNLGLQVGYRCEPWRLEGEILGLSNGYQKLTFDNLVIHRKTKHSTGFTMRGATSVVGGLVNGYLDLFTSGIESNMGAYVGIGLGAARIQNQIKFFDVNRQLIVGSRLTNSRGSPIAQGIVGFNYYADDFTTIGIDFRYITGNVNRRRNQNDSQLFNTKVNISTLNLVFNFALDAGTN